MSSADIRSRIVTDDDGGVRLLPKPPEGGVTLDRSGGRLTRRPTSTTPTKPHPKPDDERVLWPRTR